MMFDKAEYNKAWKRANKEKVSGYNKAYNLANKDKIAEYTIANKEKKVEYDKVYNIANKEKIAEYRLANKDKATDKAHKKIYGNTLTECVSQFGTSCNNCGHTPVEGERGLHTDHCHETGKVRGRLCHSCNLGIGHLGDTIEGLESAIRYLQRSERND